MCFFPGGGGGWVDGVPKGQKPTLQICNPRNLLSATTLVKAAKALLRRPDRREVWKSRKPRVYIWVEKVFSLLVSVWTV